MAVCLSRLAPQGTTVHAVDFSRPMLEVARKKRAARNIVFVVSDVKALDFDDDSLDLITIAFATRNINLNRNVLIRTFTEFRRVLKPEELSNIMARAGFEDVTCTRLLFGIAAIHQGIKP